MQFLLDTGASKSVIDKTFAGRHFPFMHSRVTEHQTTGLGASISNSEFTRLGRVRIGDFKAGRVEFALLDLSIVNGAYAEAGLDPVVAIIGGDLLKKFSAVIHYGEKSLELF